MATRWRFALVGLALLCSALAPVAANSGERDPVTGLTLRETLEKGLRARRPVEFRYLATITRMVDDGALPETLVRSTFGWARHRSGRPLQQFQFALYERAKKQGFDIPRQ